MDKIVTTSHQEGSKTVYTTKHICNGDLKSIIEYLKTTKSPKVDGVNPIITISSESNGNKIKRVMTCPLPNNFEVRIALGNQPVHVVYDFEHKDDMLVVVATNPDIINKFFKFTEEIFIEQTGPDTICFERIAKVYNWGKNYISSSYQEYDDYYNSHTLAFCFGLSQIK